MGCPGGACRGYELMQNLDFDSDGDGNSDTPWPATIRAYTSIFEGNGYTISNFSVNLDNGGLFRTIHTTAVVRNVGLINPSVIGDGGAGALASVNNGAIIASYGPWRLRHQHRQQRPYRRTGKRDVCYCWLHHCQLLHRIGICHRNRRQRRGRRSARPTKRRPSHRQLRRRPHQRYRRHYLHRRRGRPEHQQQPSHRQPL